MGTILVLYILQKF